MSSTDEELLMVALHDRVGPDEEVLAHAPSSRSTYYGLPPFGILAVTTKAVWHARFALNWRGGFRPWRAVVAERFTMGQLTRTLIRIRRGVLSGQPDVAVITLSFSHLRRPRVFAVQVGAESSELISIVHRW